MNPEGRALSLFSQMADAVAEIDRRIAVVSAHRAGLVEKRDRKHKQIPLSEREWKMWQQKIDAAEAQLLRLVTEKSGLFGSPIKAPFQEGES